jgi:2,3-bisphosphoglycerate-independent phosphoglycerate mutase
MRVLLVILDGLGDRPAPELGGQTPLEAAATPHLDRLAAEGMSGMLHAKSPGYALGSPLALHLMFGYPEPAFPDRGPLLAIARGLPPREGEVVMAARFGAGELDRSGCLILVERFLDDREAACTALGDAIAEHEVDGYHFRYVYCGRGDGLLYVSSTDGTPVSFAVTDSDPLALDLPVLRPRARSDADDPGVAEATADALASYLGWVHGTLSAHPAANEGGAAINTLLTKWTGPTPDCEPFVERWGMRPASLPDEEVVTGLVMELGFEVCQVKDEAPETDVRRRLDEAARLLGEGYEFVHLHTKYPDPMSHRNDPPACVEAIEAVDRGFGRYWETLATDEDLLTVVTTDHTTPSVWAGWPRGVFNDQHGGEPGPLAMRGGNIRVDDIAEFGERPAARGGVGQLRGADLMPLLLAAAERTNMYEMRPTPTRRLYRPRPEDLEALEF